MPLANILDWRLNLVLARSLAGIIKAISIDRKFKTRQFKKENWGKLDC